jgi:hypothetical protein
MSKKHVNSMSETSVYHVDLISSSEFDKKAFENLKKIISEVPSDSETLENFLEAMQLNSDGNVEIYIEQGNTKLLNSEDFVEFIKKIEKILGDFAGNSEFSWTVEFPYSHKTWQKNNFDWELIFDEKDDYYDDNSDYNEWEEVEEW